MIRLSEILNEQDRNSIDDLAELLESGNWLFKEPFTLRGSRTDIETFEVRSARKSRKPRDTNVNVSKLINCVHDTVLPLQFPHRTRSTFGTAQLSDAYGYGTNIYLVIPHINAKVAHTNVDPWWDYFRGATRPVNEIDNMIINQEIDKSKSDLHEQLEVLGFAMQMAARGDCTELDFYNSQYGSPFDHRKELFKSVSDQFDDSDINNYVAYLRDLIFHIGEYTDGLNLGYPDNVNDFYEVSVEGDYIYLRKDFFDEKENQLKLQRYID